MKSPAITSLAYSALLLAGCVGAGREMGAAYLSLSDQVMVTGSGRGGWSGPHQFSVADPPREKLDLIRVVHGRNGYAIFRGAEGEIWLRSGGDEPEWLRVGGRGGSDLLEVIKRRGGVEIFNEGIREFMGLGGLGA